MKLFKSHDPKIFHYTTSVCFNRVRVFRSKIACRLFIDELAQTREKCEFKLIGYVVMPDHAHLILNPLRAGLCEHPAEWKWSSYRAYLPHDPGSVPIEIDWPGYWKEEELKRLAKTAGNARL